MLVETFNLRGPGAVRPVGVSLLERQLFSLLPAYDFMPDGRKTPNKVGQGGFGQVFEARRTGSNDRVAVKFLHPHPGMETFFEREAAACDRLMKRVELPGLVKFHEFGTLDCFDGMVGYFVMSWVEGKPLGHCWASLTVPEKDMVAFQLAKTLDYLGKNHGVIHRDVKPGNIILKPEDLSLGTGRMPVLVDVGIARVLVAGESSLFETPVWSSASLRPETAMTTAGRFIGTPAYAPAEQLTASGRIGPWTDIFGLGITLMEMYEGDYIFGRRDAQQLVTARSRLYLGADWNSLHNLNAVDPTGQLTEFLRRMTDPLWHLRPSTEETVRFFFRRVKKGARKKW